MFEIVDKFLEIMISDPVQEVREKMLISLYNCNFYPFIKGEDTIKKL